MAKENSTDRRTARDFIYLTACMLNSAVPDKGRLKQMDLSKICLLAKKHMLASAIYLSLEQTGCLEYLDKELADQWRMYADAVIRKNILMNVERKNIFDCFESEGIWYVPLKGCIISDYYPDFGMREMADNDILYDVSYQEKVHDIMLERGYHVKEYKVSNHDVYIKDPVYSFEMHKDLISRTAYPDLSAFFDSIKDRLIRVSGKEYEYCLSHEDFYMFFICHAYKHYEYGGGTGLRTIADTYLLKKRFDLDERYVEAGFAQIRITKYERELTHLAEALFSEPERIYSTPLETQLTYSERQMLEYILGSGVFGTKNNLVRKRLVRDEGGDDIHFRTRISYILHRIYPKGAAYVERYPFFYRHVWAYIFLPVYRLIQRENLKSLIREAKMALKTR